MGEEAQGSVRGGNSVVGPSTSPMPSIALAEIPLIANRLTLSRITMAFDVDATVDYPTFLMSISPWGCPQSLPLHILLYRCLSARYRFR